MQGFTLPNGQYIPAFNASDLLFTPGTQYSYGDANPQTATTPGQWTLNNVGNYFPGWESLNPNNWVFSSWNKDTGMDDPNLLYLMVKSGELEGTVIPMIRQGDQWVPDAANARIQGWDTNANNRARNLTLAAIATAGTLGYMNPEWAAAGTEALQGGQAATQVGTNYLWPGGQVTAGLSPTGAPAITQLGVPGTLAGGAQNALLPASLAGATAGTGGLAAGGIPVTSGLGLQGSAGLLGAGLGVGSGAATSAAGNAVSNAVGGAGSAVGGAGGSAAGGIGSGLLDWMKANPGLALTAAGLLGGLAGNSGSKVEDLYGGRKTAIDRLNANKAPASPWGRY